MVHDPELCRHLRCQPLRHHGAYLMTTKRKYQLVTSHGWHLAVSHQPEHVQLIEVADSTFTYLS